MRNRSVTKKMKVQEPEVLDAATLAAVDKTQQSLEAGRGLTIEEARERNSIAIVLLRSWRDEDATDDPEEIRQAEEELAEFKRNVNANRTKIGDHPVWLTRLNTRTPPNLPTS